LIQSIDVFPEQACENEPISVHIETFNNWNLSDDMNIRINAIIGNDRIVRFPGIVGPRKIDVWVDSSSGMSEMRTEEIEIVSCEGTSFPWIGVVLDDFRSNTAMFHVLNAEAYPEDAMYEWSFGDGTSITTDRSVISHDYSESIDPQDVSSSFEVELRVQENGTELTNTVSNATFVSTYALDKNNGLIRADMVVRNNALHSYNGEIYSADVAITNLEDESLDFTEVRYGYIYCDEGVEPTISNPESVDVVVEPAGTFWGDIALYPDELQDVCYVTVHLSGVTSISGIRATADAMARVPGRSMASSKIVEDNEATAFITNILDQGLTEKTDAISFAELFELIQGGSAVPGEMVVEPSAPSIEGPILAKSPAPALPSLCDPQNEELEGWDCVPWIGDDGNPVYQVNELKILNALKGDALLSRGCGFVGEMLRPLNQYYSHIGIMTRNFNEVTHTTFDENRMKDYPNGSLGQATNGHQEHAVKWGFPGTVTASIAEAYANFSDEAGILERNAYSLCGWHCVDEECIAPKEWRCTEIPEHRYRISGFTYVPEYCGEGDLVAPKVLKPLWEHESRNRAALRQAAEYAKQLKTHYRFYTYSQGEIIDDPGYNSPTLDDARLESRTELISSSSMNNWPDGQGTAAASCAVFVRKALAEAGFFDPTDGLTSGYFDYTYDQRKDCVHALYNSVYNTAMKSMTAGPVDEDILRVLTGNAADDVATQFLNCFTHDHCDINPFKSSASHYEWQNPGDGHTVSPHDAYSQPVWSSAYANGKGPYGFSENLMITNLAAETMYVWKKRNDTGEVQINVYNSENVPVENASVILNNNLNAMTNADGSVEFMNVPAGGLEIFVVYTGGPGEPVFISQYENVISSDGIIHENTFDVFLPESTNPIWHLVTIAGVITMFDDRIDSKTEDTRSYPIVRTAMFAPGLPGDESLDEGPLKMKIDQCHGAEIQARTYLEILLKEDDTPDDWSDNPIEISGHAKLYEGVSCGQAWDDPVSSALELDTMTLEPQTITDRITLFRSNTEDYNKDDFMYFEFYIIHDYLYFFDQGPYRATLTQNGDYGVLGPDGIGTDCSYTFNEDMTLSSWQRAQVYSWKDTCPGLFDRELYNDGVVILRPVDNKILNYSVYNFTRNQARSLGYYYPKSIGWLSVGSERSEHYDFNPSALDFARVDVTLQHTGLIE